jgi:hypothetical protein
MAIFVSVKINEFPVKDFRIGSMQWPKEPDDVDEFFVQTLVDGEWGEAIGYMHRYGDGFGVCVQKALDTVLKDKLITNEGHAW